MQLPRQVIGVKLDRGELELICRRLFVMSLILLCLELDVRTAVEARHRKLNGSVHWESGIDQMKFASSENCLNFC
jgi:hypothetical protein